MNHCLNGLEPMRCDFKVMVSIVEQIQRLPNTVLQRVIYEKGSF